MGDVWFAVVVIATLLIGIELAAQRVAKLILKAVLLSGKAQLDNLSLRISDLESLVADMRAIINRPVDRKTLIERSQARVGPRSHMN